MLNLREELEKKIIYLDKMYRFGKPEVTDIEYDNLIQEYIKLNVEEKKIPRWINDFLSIRSSYNKQDILSFINNKKEIEFVLQPKIDGISILVIYKDFKLFGAYTRGSNSLREVTSFFLLNDILPIKTIYKDIELRGELCITEKSFIFYKEYSSARNLLSGILTRKNYIIETDLDIKFIVFEERTFIFNTESDMINNLKGFDLIESIMYKQETDLDINFTDTNNIFSTDGIVLKINNKNKQQEMGCNLNFPKWSFALKYFSKEQFAILEDIELTIGKSGKISVVGIISPKQISGKIIKKIFLHGLGTFISLNIQQFDIVFFSLRGEAINVYTKHNRSDNSVQFILDLTKCPSCFNNLLLEGKDYFCINSNCLSYLVSCLIYSAKVLNITNFGKQTSIKVVNNNIKNIFEFLNLSYEKLVIILGKGKNTDKLFLEIINIRKNLNIYNVFAALNISGIGRSSAQKMSNEFYSFSALVACLDNIENNILKNLLNEKKYKNLYEFYLKEKELFIFIANTFFNL